MWINKPSGGWLRFRAEVMGSAGKCQVILEADWRPMLRRWGLHAGKMNAEEEFQFFAEMDRVGEMVGRLFRRHPFLSRALREVSLTWWGGRLLYSAFLQPVASNCLSLMADVDR